MSYADPMVYGSPTTTRDRAPMPRALPDGVVDG